MRMSSTIGEEVGGNLALREEVEEALHVGEPLALS